jgi:DNA-directed RNA polymerase specialized sigma24 family protein
MSRHNNQSEADSSSASSDSNRRGLFDSTPWSDVLAAGDARHASQQSALESLCTVYWPPIYAYVRRKIKDLDLAQDVTQSFFERLLAGKSLRLADPARGRFRTFLIQALQWHLANQFREGRSIKRGGSVQTFALDFSSHSSAAVDHGSLTAEQIFDREWALALLNLTMQRLQEEQTSLHKSEQFGVLKNFLVGPGQTGGYAAVCGTLEMSEAGARMAVSRLRERFRELLQEEILRTVATGQDVDDEIRLLFKALSVK